MAAYEKKDQSAYRWWIRTARVDMTGANACHTRVQLRLDVHWTLMPLPRADEYSGAKHGIPLSQQTPLHNCGSLHLERRKRSRLHGVCLLLLSHRLRRLHQRVCAGCNAITRVTNLPIEGRVLRSFIFIFTCFPCLVHCTLYNWLVFVHGVTKLKQKLKFVGAPPPPCALFLHTIRDLY